MTTLFIYAACFAAGGYFGPKIWRWIKSRFGAE